MWRDELRFVPRIMGRRRGRPSTAGLFHRDRFEVTGYIQRRQGHWEESTRTLDDGRFFNATYCEFGRKFSELTVSFLRPVPESEDHCEFDPTLDRVATAPE